MKGQYDEEKLTSYLLGELPEAEAAEFEYAVSSDTALRMAAQEMEKFQVGLTDVLGGGGDKLLPRNRAVIMKAAREAARGGQVETLKSHGKSKIIYFWPVAAAAVVGLGVFVMTLVQAPKGGAAGNSVANGTKDGTTKDSKIDEISPSDIANGSLATISKAVRVEKRMPVAAEVDLLQLLQSYPLQFKQMVSTQSGSSLGVEVMACPWRPSWSLVLMNAKGVRDGNTKISFHFQAASGRKVAHGSNFLVDTMELSATAAGNQNLVRMFMVDGSSGELASIHWTVNGETAPTVILKRDDNWETSADARFARLICGYSLWLQKSDIFRNEGSISALAKEARPGNEVADRHDFLDLVDQTLKISGE